MVAALVATAVGARGGPAFSSLHSFGIFTNGETPKAGLALGTDGNFYGTTYSGGTNFGFGTVFKISTNGALTTLYAFTGGNDGANPQGKLTQGSDGSFYGTTFGGGFYFAGEVFKISTNGVCTNLYSFTSGNDGANPAAGLILASDGNFYGTASSGSSNGIGTIFKISPGGAFTPLYSFTGGDDGGNPEAELVLAGDGNFYGTAYQGGAQNSGVVFRFNTNGLETNIYSFTGGNDGANPQAALALGGDGELYGTTAVGGTNNYGAVFKISTNAVFTALYSFNGIADGSNPNAALTPGSGGALYGTAEFGGSSNSGSFFKITTNGALTNLYSFTGGNDGTAPSGALALDADGLLYGTATSGGTNRGGAVFKVTTSGTLSKLYSFPGGADGGNSAASLVEVSAGVFYGTAFDYGGTGGVGAIFRMTSAGTVSNQHVFTGGDGAMPLAGLLPGTGGNYYGTTQNGGTNNYGTVFRFNTNGGLSSLYSFTGGNDGAFPQCVLAWGTDSNLYGTADGGGSNFSGTVFKIGTNGAFTSLYSFTGGDDGSSPHAGLTLGSNGAFYGTTQFGGASNAGAIFKITTSGVLTNLYSFTGGDDGTTPIAGLTQGSDGNFYGTASAGGTNGQGVVFRIAPGGTFTNLYSFTGGDDGGDPQGALIQASDGYYYGTTWSGGPANQGTVFRINSSGTLTTVYAFPGGTDGSAPQAALLQGADGNLYGTTFWGGVGGNGTAFRILTRPVIQTAGGNFGVRTNLFGFDVTGMSNVTVVVAGSTNVSSPVWVPLATNILIDGTIYFNDPQWTNYRARFYQAETH